jgi:uncharacterized protein Yka (UPF0111/DUF47 family)
VKNLEKFLKRLFPKKSPIELLTQLSQICEEATLQVKFAIEEYFKGKDTSEYEREVDFLEKKADEIKNEIRKIYMKIRWGYFSTGLFFTGSSQMKME